MKTNKFITKPIKIIIIIVLSVLILVGWLFGYLPNVPIHVYFERSDADCYPKVYVNGKRSIFADVGIMVLRPGVHTIEVKQDGYSSSKTILDTNLDLVRDGISLYVFCDSKNRNLVVEVHDSRYPKTSVICESDCEELEIYVDGNYVFYIRNLNLTEGHHKIEIRKKGYKPVIFDIEINDLEEANNMVLNISCDKENKVLVAGIIKNIYQKAKITRKPGSESVIVYIDSVSQGSATKMTLSLGRHTITAEKEGYKPAMIEHFVTDSTYVKNAEFIISSDEETKSLKIDVVEKAESEESED